MKITNFILHILSLSFFIGCAHTPKCGNLEGAKTIYNKANSCEVRIRQVTIGTDLKIPDSLKKPEIVGLNLEWVDPSLQDGKIILGHFVLTAKLKNEEKGRQ